MAKFTERDEIEVALRYIARVRSMQPSAGALKTLDDEEARLKAALRKLNESSAPRGGSISLSSTTSIAKPRHRAGF